MSSESDRHNKGDQPQMVGRFCCVHCRKDEAAYDMLSQTYEVEQKQLEVEAITLQQEIEVQERQIESILIAFRGKVKSITIIIAEILLMSVIQLKKGRYSVER